MVSGQRQGIDVLDDDDMTFSRVPPSDPEALACVAAYVAELAEVFEQGFEPANGNPTPDDGELTPPNGGFLIARSGGKIAGCGAVRRLADGRAEIKRMWISPEMRGRGFSRTLLKRLEDEARSLGMDRVVLDTNRALIPAQTLYRRSGYREISRYNDNPYADFWFEKVLD